MSTATSDLSKLFARQIQENRLGLPAMPGTAASVLELCQRDDTDAAKLSAVIHRDQTIASHVLRVANSAAYAGQMPCASLQQAVSRLGMQLIVDISMAVAVRGRLFGNKTCAELLATLWGHSVLTGFYTKEIARLRRRNVEIAFLCGLLHDIGEAVLLDNVDRVLGKHDLQLPVADLVAAVQEQHVDAGVLLAKQWKMPDQIVEAVQCHHDWEAAQSFRDMTMTVHLADMIAQSIKPSLDGVTVEEESVRMHPVIAGLNLYQDQLDELFGLRERALLVTESLR
ncbi:MAG: hypothetical protein RL398_2220 [Planctomycetota bacterium]